MCFNLSHQRLSVDVTDVSESRRQTHPAFVVLTPKSRVYVFAPTCLTRTVIKETASDVYYSNACALHSRPPGQYVRMNKLRKDGIGKSYSKMLVSTLVRGGKYMKAYGETTANQRASLRLASSKAQMRAWHIPRKIYAIA